MEMILDKEIGLLRGIKAINDCAFNSVTDFFRGREFVALAKDFDANLKKRDVDIGFNLFAIISDMYHRENFHSDILKAIIAPEGGHGEKGKYLELFLDFLRSRGTAINPADYQNVEVTREQGKVDLLIKDQTSAKAIILENKINGAGDMDRQIPRYLEYVKAAGYACDAVVYLRLNGYAHPNTTGWTPKERKEVRALMTVISAYEETDGDLLNGWILKCQSVSTNPDARRILKQYGQLITKLGENIMNKPIIEKFYRQMIEGENLKTALSLRSMLEEMIVFRRDEIVEAFKHSPLPFGRVTPYQNAALFMDLFVETADLGIDIRVHDEHYLFYFWDRRDHVAKEKRAELALRKMNWFQEYEFDGCGFSKTFAFPAQERDLYPHVRDFQARLTDMLAASELK